MPKAQKTMVAYHDPAHCLAPGLFRSLKSGQRKEKNLNVVYKFGNDAQVEFVAPKQLGADDLRVLQGLVALAGQKSDILPLSPPEEKTETDVQQRLRVLLKPKYDALNQEALTLKCKITALIAEIGMQKSGKTVTHIYDCIKRLSYVSVGVVKGNRWAITHLMSSEADEADGRLIVALNPLLTRAILKHQNYTIISMEEVRALKSDPARLIHQRLCGWINPGGNGRVTLETICEYAWPEETTNDNTMRYRRMVARKALAELESLGWSIEEYSTEKYQITRPDRKVI